MHIFDYDSPLMRFLSSVGDIILLNLFYILTCLPLITIGAANTALYFTADQLQENLGNLIPNYFRAFKSNFLKSTLAWLAFIAIAALLLLNYKITKLMPQPLTTVFSIVYISMGILCLSLYIFIFPLLAIYEGSTWQLIKKAILLGISQFPKLLLFLALALLPVSVLVFATAWFIRLIPLWLLGYFSIEAGIKAGLLKKTLNPIQNK